MNINLHIDCLVLDDISVEPHQRKELKAAMEAHLGNLLVSKGIGSSVQSNNIFRVIQGGLISLESQRSPLHMGQEIAGAIYHGIK